MARMTPFQKAFAAARADKKKDFEFPPRSGRRFSTQTAEEQGREIGAKAAAGSGRGAFAGRTAADQDTGPGRPGPKTPAGPRRDKAAEAKGVETLERMKAREERNPSRLQMAGLTPGSTTLGQSLGAAAGMAAPKGAQILGRGLMSAMERRAAAEGAKRIAREEAKGDGPAFDLPPQGSVFRSNRPPKDDIPTLRDAVEYKKGGTAKAYAKGGSVKGGGCETRSKKTRYV